MEREKQIYKVSALSITINILLSLIKLVCGVVGHSKAMISDAIHTISDVFTTIIVIISAKISSKESDSNHPYGHERYECVFSTVLAILLAITAFFIGYNGLKTVINHQYKDLPIPNLIALCAAIISIILKEFMYLYTIKVAKRINSLSLKADAHHHSSDALSSIGSLIGIGGSMLGFPIMDCIASIVIALFILKSAWDIFMSSMNQMIDVSCDEDTINNYKKIILNTEGVLRIDLLKTRLFASKVYIDIEISVNKDLTLIEAHSIAEAVHHTLEKTYSNIKHCMVHVNPYIEK